MSLDKHGHLGRYKLSLVQLLRLLEAVVQDNSALCASLLAFTVASFPPIRLPRLGTLRKEEGIGIFSLPFDKNLPFMVQVLLLFHLPFPPHRSKERIRFSFACLH